MLKYFGYIYKTTNLLNNKVYIGKKHNKEFIPSYYGSGLYIERAIKKYGIDNFKVEPLAYGFNKAELNILERYYINNYRKEMGLENVYNIAKGGEGGIGGIATHLPDCNCAACSNRRDGRYSSFDNAMKGKKLNREQRKRISIMNIGNKNACGGSGNKTHNIRICRCGVCRKIRNKMIREKILC